VSLGASVGSEPLAAPGVAPAPPGSAASVFRGDVDGLRAVAIVLVVAYHALVPGFHGGFIGVDMFFVISGFLITRNLLSEADRAHRIALLSFWAKRIRRLVPALALMIAVVVVLTVLIVPKLDWSTVAEQGRWAALYISNLMFARQASSYFGADVQTSLFLHTWSLGVEEQFYLVWPLLFGGACLLARRRRDLLRPLLIAGFSVTLVLSLGLCVSLTQSGSTYAFYGLPARAWEFAAAGLLAALPVPRALHTRAAQLLAAGAGVALLLIALVVLSDTTPYPGLWALLPVAATALIVLAGSAPVDEAGPANFVSRGLALAPCQWLGRVSYSWYLWHWPFILLAVVWFSRDQVSLRVAASLVALGVATVTFRLIEKPVRFSPRLRRSLALTFVVGALVTVAVLLFTFGLSTASSNALSRGELKKLSEARKDEPTHTCARNPTSPHGITYCEDGDLTATRSVMLVGDSHAGHWQTAFAAAAKAAGIRLYVLWQERCPAMPIPISTPTNDEVVDSSCVTYRGHLADLLGELHPDAVVVSQTDSMTQSVVMSGQKSNSRRAQLWEKTYEQYLTSLRQQGYRVGRVVATPQLPVDPVECLARTSSPSTCNLSVPSEYALSKVYMHAEAQAASHVGHVLSFDVNHAICPGLTCPAQLKGDPVFIDRSHLSKVFTLSFVPRIETFLHQLTSS
jgi:peptidoglycan/LPS O-acetylase OafA/YrhL